MTDLKELERLAGESVSTVLDRDSDAVLRAFWRRVQPFVINMLASRELPEKIPVQLSAPMRTALNALRLDDITAACNALPALLELVKVQHAAIVPE